MSSCFFVVFDFENILHPVTQFLKGTRHRAAGELRMWLRPIHFFFFGNDPVRISTVVFPCRGMMDTVLFLPCVPFAQKLSGKGNPLLWWGRWLYPKGNTSMTHRTLEPPWLHTTLHPQILWVSLMIWFYLQVFSRSWTFFYLCPGGVCLLIGSVGWFVSRITRKLLNMCPKNLDGGWDSAQSRHHKPLVQI